MCQDDYEQIHSEDVIPGLRFEKKEMEVVKSGSCGVNPLQNPSRSQLKTFEANIETGMIFICEEYQYVQERLTWDPTGSY